MAGGHVLTNNLVFNMVRETQDHGTFNSWDRQPFMYTGADGKPTFVPRTNRIGPHNFFENDYNPQEAVDNDDSSAYYETHHNFFPFSTGGTHPIGNVVEGNFIHEIGIFQKQVSCYFQAQTEGSTLSNNICFNGPRAGINFNDGPVGFLQSTVSD